MKRFMFLLSFVFIFVSLTAQEAPAEAPAADENQPAAAQEAAPAAETPAEQPAPAEEPAKEEAPAEQPAPAEEPAKEETPAEQPAPAEEPAKEEAPAADATAEAPAEAPAEEAAPAAAEPADPHHFIYFKPQLSASYIHNSSVAGMADGHYFQTDANIIFNYKYKEGMHEVLTDLNWKEGVSRTPAFDGWVIANDLFKIDFRYNLMFHKIAGYYLKAGLETHFFRGYDYQSEDTDYIVKGDNSRNAKGQRKFKTAEPGKPFYLTEGTGIFVRPVEREEANLEIYAGLSAREVWVGNTLALDDDDTTDEIELKELNDVYELGAEAGLSLKGFLKDRLIGYDLMARLIKPFYMPDDTKVNYSEDGTVDGYSELDSLQFETRFRLDFNIHKYVALNYELNVKRDYAVVRDWQVSNAIYLSIFYELDKKM